MGNLKLFRLESEKIVAMAASSLALEKSLQKRMEANLETLLGVRFLASEYSTGPKHGGRIDSLGLDENGCPVIIEYKRATNQNVINQGLFYLDWLMDHQAEFELLVMKELGAEAAKNLFWPGVRLICVAGNYTKYDLHAVDQINRNIDLVRHVLFGDDLLLLELVNAQQTSSETSGKSTAEKKAAAAKTVKALDDLNSALREYLLGLGDDVQEKQLKLYTAFKRLKNFACVRLDKSQMRVWLKLAPESVELKEGFSRDMREVGHWGTGDLELTLKTTADLEKAKPLLDRAYEEN